jgi:hypothetical protein
VSGETLGGGGCTELFIAVNGSAPFFVTATVTSATAAQTAMVPIMTTGIANLDARPFGSAGRSSRNGVIVGSELRTRVAAQPRPSAPDLTKERLAVVVVLAGQRDPPLLPVAEADRMESRIAPNLATAVARDKAAAFVRVQEEERMCVQLALQPKLLSLH